MTQVPLVFHVGLGKLGLGFVIPLLAGRASVVGCHRQLAGDAAEEKKRLLLPRVRDMVMATTPSLSFTTSGLGGREPRQRWRARRFSGSGLSAFGRF